MLLIHDLTKENSSDILSLLPPKTKILSKEINNIHPCCGCFKCWTKTPGKCAINDSYTEMPKYILHSNVLIIITKIYYGCYSPYIKNVIDRSIGILLPFFQKINGEIHHVYRYNRSPKFVVIGYGENITPNEETTFRALIKANSLNLNFKDYKTFIVNDISKIKETLENLSRSSWL
ncbi:NAD(P)H-dependent oxidoreductase [Clostridium botulinum]|uniref:Flavodoxin family protein n=1 Tax=Clostridium botulinum TaxID=1491 RepID=A0A846J6T1_CLOBO|nr:NAD(P)H-dependent oxidoreductase [Clostridium botulinum]ACA55362.1 conserved hypothetical protein [Clostridium botulinum A3 str. Loch Maree]NFH65404.1 flavodoxin family protein [Clostridium botulinum]NFJ09826.1 flavodoxin family protein [Clostridium botulinum]NFK14806.1 flavodoxin family protein [Clostridium botulinum]NFM94715.1 flavodoxin family protein [Clostridium botulinum]